MKTTAVGIVIAAIAATTACKKDKTGGGAGSGSGSGSGVTPLVMPALGVDAIKVMNYPYGDGAKDYEKALVAYKAKDWAGVRDACTAAIGKDAMHLDAHYRLAVALIQLGQPADAVDHLTAALGGDWLSFGPQLAEDKDLAPLWTTPQGKAVQELATRMAAAAKQELAAAVIVLGRRSSFKWPSKPGAQWAATRGEVYALDLTVHGAEVPRRRYIRLSHTDHTVAAVLMSPSGAEVAIVGYDKVEMPDPTKPAAPPLIARGWVEVHDAKTWEPTGKRAVIEKGRAVAAAWGAGDQLLVASIAPAGRWDLGAATYSVVDRTTGKLSKTAAPPAGTPQAVVTLDDGWIERGPAGVKATWSAATGTTPPLADKLELPGGKVVDAPESGKAAEWSVTVSPGSKRIAMATWVDPCAKEASTPSLYEIDVASGQLKHLLTASSSFRSQWLDDDHLIYEDGDGALRVWDGTVGHEAQRITERGGLALGALSSHPGPICKAAPPAIEPDTGGEETAPGDGSGAGSGEPGPATVPN